MTTDNPQAKAINPKQAIRSGPTLQRWRQQFKINRKMYATLSDCSPRTLATLESKNRLSLPKERKLNETHRLILALCEIMEPRNIADWLTTPNEWFDQRTPLKAISEGKADKVWELIYHTKEGGYL